MSVVKMSAFVPRSSSRGAFVPFGFRNILLPKSPSLRVSANYVSASNNAILPRLPVPALDVTLNKYLKSIKPLLSPQEYDASTNLIKEFGSKGGIGEKLQNLLVKRAAIKENWLADWWLHSAYLDFRWPVVVYSSPGLVFPFQTFNSKNDQFQYAAKVITGAIDYKKLVDNDEIAIDKMGKDPLDMSQYKKIFGTCRIPGIKRDSITFNNSNHIIVIHNNHLFKLPFVGSDGKRLNEEQLAKQLGDIAKSSSEKTSDAIGVLTSEHRDTWGKIYDQLIKDPTNRSNFKAIEESAFVLCLDVASNKTPISHEVKQIKGAGNMIHGLGSSFNAGNRWYDKTLQFVVGEDGITGLTYEHSPAEGQPVAVLIDYVVDYVNKKNEPERQPSMSVPNFERLNFNISKETKDAISKANNNVDKLADDLELNCFTFKMYGKEFIKSQKLSPDSFIQMAMQYAFFRLHGVPGAHYESAGTRKYIGGRTETIRSCSIESVDFAKTMLDSQSSLKEKVQALKTAIKAHKDYSVEAVNGFGVDRHLLGLKLTALENGIEIPKLYSDAGFVKSAHMRLSTSQVAAKFDGFMCYAPLVPDGYSTCYNPRANEINFATAAFNADTNTSAQKYRQALENSLIDMHNVLLQSTQSKL